MKSNIYGVMIAILINMLMVSLVTIAFKEMGKIYLFIVNFILIMCGSVVGLRLGSKI